MHGGQKTSSLALYPRMVNGFIVGVSLLFGGGTAPPRPGMGGAVPAHATAGGGVAEATGLSEDVPASALFALAGAADASGARGGSSRRATSPAGRTRRAPNPRQHRPVASRQDPVLHP